MTNSVSLFQQFRYWCLKHRVRVGRLSSILSPGYGACGRCKTNWQFADSHSTQYSDSSGCFSLCERCWSDLTPETRLPYYEEMFRGWGETDASQWRQIRDAVLSGG